MAGFIGARASVVSSGAERKQTYAITTTTTSLTGLAYTPTKVHVYHNGIRLVDGTDYTATDGETITLTTAAENGDEVVVISYATFQTSDTVSAANGGTFAGNVSMNGTLEVTGATTLTGQLNTGSILPSTDNASDLGSTSKRFQDLHLSGGVSFDEDPSLVTGSVSSKTLDDYEEGTWTPAITGITVTSGTFNGTYRKIGGLVSLTMRMENCTLTGSGSNITGLPFACALRTSSSGPVVYNHPAGDKPIGILIEGGTSNAYLQYNTAAAWANAPFTAGANRYIAVQMTYTTNA
jgi:hypothetical protein